MFGLEAVGELEPLGIGDGQATLGVVWLSGDGRRQQFPEVRGVVAGRPVLDSEDAERNAQRPEQRAVPGLINSTDDD